MKRYPVYLHMPSEQHLVIRPAYNSESGSVSRSGLPSLLPSELRSLSVWPSVLAIRSALQSASECLPLARPRLPPRTLD
jgi:hypothetical protein